MHLLGKKNSIFSSLNSNKNVIVNIIASAGIRVMAILVSVMTTPAYMRYFGDSSVLGVWLTIISLLTTIGVLDFGLGNGLRNKLTVAISSKDEHTAKNLISSSYLIISVISVVLWVVGVLLSFFINWNMVLGIDASILNNHVLRRCCIIVLTGVMLQMILKVVTSILYAQQKSALVSFLPLLTNSMMLLFVVVAQKEEHTEGLIILSWVYLIAANVPYLVTTFWLFAGELKRYIPNRKYIDCKVAQSIMKLGLLFFYLQVMSIMVHNTNEILISALFDSSMVVEYQIYNKIFYLITTGINVIMIPLWSAVTKALCERKYSWLIKLHKLLCRISVLALAMGVIITCFMQKIVDVWLGDQTIAINRMMCVPFIIYVALEAFNGANATIANGTNWIKMQMIFSPISAVLNIPLTFLLREVLVNWVAIQVANIISLLPIAIAQYIYIRRKLTNVEKEILQD